MVRVFPALTVEGLMAKAGRDAKTGPAKPTPANMPTGATLDHVRQTAKRLGIAK
jgi:hypothetical protein